MSLFSMLRASQTPHYNHFVALCYVRVEVIHRIKFLRYYLKAEVQREQHMPWRVVRVDVSRSAPGHRKGEPRPRLFRDYLWLETARWLRDEAPVFVATGESEQRLLEELAGELSSVRYAVDSSGRLVVESKDDIRKRL